MIEHIDISGVHYDVDELTKKYATRKIGRLDRFVPRHARKTMTAEIRLKQINKEHDNKYECEVNLSVPGKVINANDSTMNMLAAIDIVEQKLVQQLRKYKAANTPKKGFRARVARFRAERAGL